MERLHQRIEAVLGDSMPTHEDEENAPQRADARYDEAIRRLIGLTRDRQRFALLFSENVNYGMRRNLLGLRSIGLAVASITAVAAALLVLLAPGEFTDRAAHYAPAVSASLVELIFWLTIVDRQWVKVPAEAYADRLVESVDQLRSD